MQTNASHPEEKIPKPADHAAIEHALSRAVAHLQAGEQNGWWPYVSDRGPSTEATGWCAIALYASLGSGFDSARTTDYLLKKQNRDGGWSTTPSVTNSDWSTAPAVLALRLLNQKAGKPGDSANSLPNMRSRIASDAVDRAVINGSNFLFDLRTDPWKSVARFLIFLTQGESGLNYARGWPWTRDCSFWVEPTAYSLLALKLPGVPDRMITREAIHHASQYLHTHVCKGGGWNHGAVYVLKVYAPPYSLTTAEALVALQDEPRSPTIEAGLKFITGDHYDSDSSLPLAWAILALHAYEQPLGNKVSQLLAHQNADGSFGTNNMVTGVAVLALLAASRNNNLLKMSTQGA